MLDGIETAQRLQAAALRSPPAVIMVTAYGRDELGRGAGRAAQIGARQTRHRIQSARLKTLPLGTAYAIWVGIGSIGTAVLGIVLFGDPATAGRLLSFLLIFSGVVGLKLTTYQ